MSNIDFDDTSEQELAAIEASPTGDLLRSAAGSLAPQSQFASRLEAHLRALPTNKPAPLGATTPEKAPEFAIRAARQSDVPIKGNNPNSGRIWRVASVGLGLAATLVLAFLLTGLFGSGAGPIVAGVPVREFVPPGQVRHMVFTASTVVTGTVSQPADKKLSGSSPLDFWLANENGRLLARHGNPSSGEYWQLLTSDNYYEHPDPGSMNVYKYPYDIEHVRQIPYGDLAVHLLPDAHLMDTLLALPNASILGESVLNGHNVTFIYVPGSKAVLRTENIKGDPYEEMVDRWYWVDRSTSQVIRVEARFTTTTGDKTGFQFGFAIELTQNEILSRSAVSADYFTFTAPSWANVVDGTTTGASPASGATPGSDEFVPEGKVRHITLAQSQVSTHTTGEVYTETTHLEEFWLAPGTNHPLMRTHVTIPMEAWTWVDETNYYEYEPSRNSEIQRLTFDSKIQASILPDPNIITATLALPGAVSLGETTLNGRRALLIERSDQPQSAEQRTPTIPSKGKGEPTPSDPTNAQVEANTYPTTRYWIDLQTNQILQIEFMDVAPDGSTKKTVNYIALDELLDRSALPADFFVPTRPTATSSK